MRRIDMVSIWTIGGNAVRVEQEIAREPTYNPAGGLAEEAAVGYDDGHKF